MNSKKVYEFDDFVFDTSAYKLFRNGQPIRLQQRTGELLELLLMNAQIGLIPKEKILDRLYGKGGPATDYALYFQVHQLRRALADNAKNPKYIQFAKKRGIQFIGKLRTVEAEVQENVSQDTVPSPSSNLILETVASREEHGVRKLWGWRILLPLLILPVILIMLFLILKSNRAFPAPRIIPRINSITALSAPVAGRQIYVQLNGEGFNPGTIRILVIGPGCLDDHPCCVPNEPLHWYGSVTDLQIERVPLTLAPGDFQIFVQNGPDGEASNAMELTIRVEKIS